MGSKMISHFLGGFLPPPPCDIEHLKHTTLYMLNVSLRYTKNLPRDLQ